MCHVKYQIVIKTFKNTSKRSIKISSSFPSQSHSFHVADATPTNNNMLWSLITILEKSMKTKPFSSFWGVWGGEGSNDSIFTLEDNRYTWFTTNCRHKLSTPSSSTILSLLNIFSVKGNKIPFILLGAQTPSCILNVNCRIVKQNFCTLKNFGKFSAIWCTQMLVGATNEYNFEVGFLCFPRYSSISNFGPPLGEGRGPHWFIHPLGSTSDACVSSYAGGKKSNLYSSLGVFS